ncbi:hypothetical protein [Saccharopolyspora shandongensis]|uniref:hypothetical protein n=1 Tax=Saccharopolyspora shandongensis TaxID=418495 RepID=UPI0033C936D5
MVNDNNRETDRHHASALRILENGPYAPQCPHGHGPLTTIADHTAPTGVAMACRQCGQRRGMEVTMLRTLLNPENADFDQPLATSPTDNPAARAVANTDDPTLVAVTNTDASEPADTDNPEPADTDDDPELVAVTTEIPRVQLEDTAREPLGKITSHHTRDDADGDEADLDHVPPPPRGHQPDGTIRTTGWLQLGTRPISSGLWAALAGAALGLALIDLNTWLPLVLPAAAYVLWFATTRWIRPASAATNLEQVYADELLPGDAIRIYGPIGPVGVVDQVTQAANEQVLVRFAGGTQRFLPADARCHLVALRN